MRAAQGEPITIYTRCAIQHDKSVAVNCLVLLMSYWHKVQTSCRQTQPVVLRCGVRFRLCSSTKQAGALTPRLLHALSVEEESRRMMPHFLLTSSIYRGLIRIWPVWRKPHQYTPDHPGVCDHVNLKTLVQTWMGDMNGNYSSSAI